jgi:putative proteasome-type protease
LTFCLGIKTEQGLVGIADTRITTGTERLTARKVSIHEYGERPMFVMTSGLRSVRDKALTYFDEVIDESEHSFDRLYKAVNALAKQIGRVAKEDEKALKKAGLRFNLHTLVGGQLENDDEHRLYMLYPQGNWVEVSQASPYYIIGESGYGKSLLDRVLRYDTPLETALKAGYLAFDATRNSTIDVAFPLDVVLYRQGTSKMVERRFEEDQMQELSSWWQQSITEQLDRAPTAWMTEIFGELEDQPIFRRAQSE